MAAACGQNAAIDIRQALCSSFDKLKRTALMHRSAATGELESSLT